MNFKAVFFDLDGTLVNSLEDLASSTNYVLNKYNFPQRKTEKFKLYAGDGIAKMIERALPENNRDKKTVDMLKKDFMEYYSIHYADKTVPYDGMKELILDLKAKGLKVAVVTNKAQEMAEKVVTKLFGNSFDYILGMRPEIPAKPDPTGVFAAMDKLGVKPNETAFVGDTGMDVLAGVNSGAFPIGVLWGFREKDELVKFGAKAFALNSNELYDIVTK